MVGPIPSRAARFLALQVLATGAVFALDLREPLGRSPWIAYLLLLPIAFSLQDQVLILGWSGIWSALIILGYALAPEGGDRVAGVLDRTIGVALLWILCGAALAYLRIQARLSESEGRLRLFVEHAPAAFAMFDRDMRYLAVSRRWLEDYRLSGDVIGRSYYETFSDIPEAWKAVHLRALAGESTSSGGERFVRADGAVHWERWDALPWHTAEGEVGGILIATEEITARKEAEEVLRRFNAKLEREVALRTAESGERENRLRAILDNAFGAILTVDSRGIIEGANKAAERMFGYAAEELIGTRIRALIPPARHEGRDGDIPLLSGAGEARILGASRERPARRKDGSPIDVALSVSRMDHLGLFTVILLDISRRKELEREVVDIAALEQQRIGQDLHDDVGQELTGLGLLVDSMLDVLREESPESVAVAEKIERGVRRTLQKVRTIARGLALAEVGPDELPDVLAELASRLGETSGVRCEFRSDPGVPVADPLQATHLYHIAQEACTNALKHAGAGTLEVSLRSEGRSLVLRVRDDGIGMADAREGLGRRIMRNRAKVIGARLTVEPARPHGTAVTCVLDPERTDGR